MECGVVFVMTLGMRLMLELCVHRWDIQDKVLFRGEELTLKEAHTDLSVSVTFSVMDQKADCKTVVYLKVLAQPVITLEMLVSCVLVNDY